MGRPRLARAANCPGGGGGGGGGALSNGLPWPCRTGPTSAVVGTLQNSAVLRKALRGALPAPAREGALVSSGTSVPVSLSELSPAAKGTGTPPPPVRLPPSHSVVEPAPSTRAPFNDSAPLGGGGGHPYNPQHTTNTHSDPQRVRMSSGEGPMGAAKGKQTSTMASCQPPPPPRSLDPPPRPLKDWAKFSSGPMKSFLYRLRRHFGLYHRFSSGPSAPVKPQHHRRGGGGGLGRALHPPNPTGGQPAPPPPHSACGGFPPQKDAPVRTPRTAHRHIH